MKQTKYFKHARLLSDAENLSTEKATLENLAHMKPSNISIACSFPSVGTHASVRAATPGNSLPSMSSNDAPPPVLQCVTLSTVLYTLQAVAVSPPPITDTAPPSVAATTASISDFVPASNLPISNTPMGPFQTIVFDASTAALFNSIDLGSGLIHCLDSWPAAWSGFGVVAGGTWNEEV